jgi:hypothetical protein
MQYQAPQKGAKKRVKLTRERLQNSLIPTLLINTSSGRNQFHQGTQIPLPVFSYIKEHQIK